MTAIQLRHGATTVDLHDRLTLVTGLDADRAMAFAAAIASGDAGLVFAGEPADADGGPSPVFALPTVAASADGASSGTADLQAAVDSAEAALRDARAGFDRADAAYTAAQDELLVLRRDADRDAPAALEEAERRLEEAESGAAEARRALDAAREEASVREADLGTIRDLQQRRERARAARDEIAARLTRLPAVVDVEPVRTALEGLRRLRNVKPRPMARAVEIADRLQEIEASRAEMAVESPPEWLVKPALDALRSAKAELAALESGKPTVAVDPEKVSAVERCHERVLEAEARVMEKGSRSNRRRLDEATAAERDALHALGLSSYDQFLKYLAPTLDASAREERLTEARASVADAETVWAELHGGAVPEGWTELHLERATLQEEAAGILGADVDVDQLDEALRQHLEAVVDTTWAEDALASALAGTKAPVAPGGLEAAAEQIIAEAPVANQEREAAESELAEIDAELRSIEEELASLSAGSFLGGSGPPDGEDGDAADGPPANLAQLEEAVRAAEDALGSAKEAVAAARERVERSAAAAVQEQAAAEHAEAAKADVAAAKRVLADAEQALASASRAAADALDSVEKAAAAAEALLQGSRLEARLGLLGRAVAHQASGRPLIVTGGTDVLGPPAAALSVLRALSAAVQVVVIDSGGLLAEAGSALGDAGRVVRL